MGAASEVVVGVLGCPNLGGASGSARGWVFSSALGHGATAHALDGGGETFTSHHFIGARLQQLGTAEHSIQLIARAVSLLSQVGSEPEELLPLAVDRSRAADADLLNLGVEEWQSGEQAKPLFADGENEILKKIGGEEGAATTYFTEVLELNNVPQRILQLVID